MHIAGHGKPFLWQDVGALFQLWKGWQGGHLASGRSFARLSQFASHLFLGWGSKRFDCCPNPPWDDQSWCLEGRLNHLGIREGYLDTLRLLLKDFTIESQRKTPWRVLAEPMRPVGRHKNSASLSLATRWCPPVLFVCWFMIYKLIYTSSTAQDGGGSFKNRKPIGEIGCCESGMAERIHWWTERCLRSPLFHSLSLTIYLPIYLLCIYLSIYLSISLSLSRFHLSSCLPVYLSIYLSICPSVYLSICGAVSFSVV